MKKLFVGILSFLLVISLVGCASQPKEPEVVKIGTAIISSGISLSNEDFTSTEDTVYEVSSYLLESTSDGIIDAVNEMIRVGCKVAVVETIDSSTTKLISRLAKDAGLKVVFTGSESESTINGLSDEQCFIGVRNNDLVEKFAEKLIEQNNEDDTLTVLFALDSASREEFYDAVVDYINSKELTVNTVTLAPESSSEDYQNAVLSIDACVVESKSATTVKEALTTQEITTVKLVSLDNVSEAINLSIDNSTTNQAIKTAVNDMLLGNSVTNVFAEVKVSE